ncbi:MAG: hypothetical protein R3F30_14345 [Planctomycetota bacterium]
MNPSEHQDPNELPTGPVEGGSSELDIASALREAEDRERQVAHEAATRAPVTSPDEPEPSKDPWGLPEPAYDPTHHGDALEVSQSFGDDRYERERRINENIARTQAMLAEQKRKRAVWEGIAVMVAARTVADPLHFGPWSVLGAVVLGALAGKLWGAFGCGRALSVLLGLPFVIAHIVVFTLLVNPTQGGTYFGVTTVGGIALFVCLAAVLGVGRETID